MNKFELEKLNITIHKEQNIAHLLTTTKKENKREGKQKKEKEFDLTRTFKNKI